MNARYTMTFEDVIKCYDLTALQNYPIFDEKYRGELNNAIINYYSIYEIGSETVEMFNNRLYSKLLTIMPYYNQLFELELSIKKMTIDKLFTNRYDIYETGNSKYNATSNKTGDDTVQHGLTINYTQGLRTDNTVTYGSSTNVTYGSSTDVKHGLKQTTDDDRISTTNTKQLGGKNIIESATLSADTPQNNSPIADKVGGDAFDSFDNTVFAINGYLSRADKTLNINERHDENDVTSSVDGDLTLINSGTDTTDKYGTDTTSKSGMDTTNTYQSGGTTTQNTGNDTTIYNNITTDNNITDNTKHQNGNSDYIKSINDLRDSFININMMIIKELKNCFLEVF